MPDITNIRHPIFHQEQIFMKKNTTLLLFLILSFPYTKYTKAQDSPFNSQKLKLASSIAPTILDSAIIRCKYKQVLVVPNNNGQESTKKNIMLLQIGRGISKYVDLKKITSDSLINIYKKEGIDNDIIIRRILAHDRGTISEIIFKNYPKNKITFTNYLMASYLYEEDYVSPEWALRSDTNFIIGYLCKKATTTFRGRNYTAWYALDIPIDNGPWKFKGLPGLILKIEDDKKEVSFECIAIEKVKWKDKIYIANPNLKYIRTTKTAYKKMVRNFMNNPAAFIQPMLQGDLPVKASQRQPYNPIELSE